MSIMGCVSSKLQDEHLSFTMPTKDIFLFKDVVGKGGFGRVLSALHSTGVAMITGELDALKKVSHPFVICLHMAFHDTFYCYFVSDLKTGKDLRYYVKRHKTFDEDQIAFFVACMCSALHHVHNCRIIHRDVKLENIVLDARGYPHITDFGVAYVQPLEEIGYPLQCLSNSGTKPYLAPEIFCKSHIHGPEADYWSLGVVAYELYYGKRPFERHVPHEYIHYLEAAASTKKQDLKRIYRDKTTSLSAGTSLSAAVTSIASTSMLSSYSSSNMSSAISSKYSSNASSPLGTPGSPTPCNSAAAAAFLNDVPGAFPDISHLNIDEHIDVCVDLTGSLLDSYSSTSEEVKDEMELSPFGLDSWAVDAILPKELKPKIPFKAEHETLGKKTISDDFVSILQGLMELRPSYRLGGRNIHALKAHPFFSDNGVSNWDYICTKAHVPRLNGVPLYTRAAEETSKSESINVMCDLDGRIMDVSEKSCQPETAISDEAQRQFKSFNYIRPEHLHMFEQKPIALTSKNSASSSSLGAALSSTSKLKKVYIAERPSPSSSGSSLNGNKCNLPNIYVGGASGGSGTIVKPKVFF